MNIVLKHPAIHDLLQSGKEEKSLSFSHKTTLLETFKGLISEAVATNKTVVVSSNHAKDLKELFEYTRSYYQLAMHVDGEFVSTESIYQWRLALKKKSNIQNRLVWNGVRRNIASIESEIDSYFTQTYHKNLSNLKVDTTQNEFDLYMPILEYCLPSHLFNGTEIEFHDLKRLVSKFAHSYNTEYKLLDQVTHFSDFMTDVNESENIPLDSLAQRSSELTILFLNNINSYKSKWQTQLKSQEKIAMSQLRSLNLINEKLTSLNLELSNSSSFIERLTSNFQTKTQQENFKYSIELEFDEWLEAFSSELPKIHAEYSLAEESTIEPNILMLRKRLQSYINEVIKQKQFEGQQQFNQLNAQNCPKIFKDILDELKDFYAELAKHNLLDAIGKDKSFNLHSSYQYLLKVKAMLDSLVLMNKAYPTYVQWKKELNGLNKLEKLIISTFVDQFADNLNWSAIFEEYYSKILRSIAIPDMDINVLLSKYTSLTQNENAIQKDSLNNIQKFDIRQHIESLKTTNSKLFKELFQKKYKENSISIYTLFDQMNELLPLCFVRKEILGQSTNSNWDIHIHLDVIGRDEVAKDLPVRGDEFVHLQYKTAAADIQFDSKTYLKHPKVQTDENQLNFCRTLSQKLSLYQNRIQIFNCGEMFIVSFLDKLLNVQMLETNEHLTFKEFIIDNDLNYSLEDIFFKRESKIHVLTQDGVLNPYDSSSLDWQMHLIQLMKRARMNIQSVSLAELMESNYTSILLKKSDDSISDLDTQKTQMLTASTVE